MQNNSVINLGKKWEISRYHFMMLAEVLLWLTPAKDTMRNQENVTVLIFNVLINQLIVSTLDKTQNDFV